MAPPKGIGKKLADSDAIEVIHQYQHLQLSTKSDNGFKNLNNLVFRHIFIPICSHQNIRNDVDLHLSPFTLDSSLFNAAFLLHAIYFIHYCFPCKMFHTSSIIQIWDFFFKRIFEKTMADFTPMFRKHIMYVNIGNAYNTNISQLNWGYILHI